MKIGFGLILALLVTVDASAQTATNSGTRAAGSITSAAPSGEGKTPAPLPLNTPVVVNERVVVVRGKPDINGEPVGHLKRGDTVTVLEEVTIHPGPDEPARWAKIALPEGIHVWVNRLYVDTNGVVTPARLNVRTGPGENYSVAGLLHRGDTIKELSAKGDWREIEAPPGVFAFVAAHLLKAKPEPVKPVEFVAVPVPAPKPVIGEPAHATVAPVEKPKTAAEEPIKPVATPVIPPPVPVVETPKLVVEAPKPVVETPKPVVEAPKPAVVEPAPTLTVVAPPVTNAPSVVTPPSPPVTESAKSAAPPVEIPVPPPAVTNEVAPLADAVVPVPEPPVEKRIVTREGIVRGTVSIQAPTHYQLQSLDNGKVLNYLYSTKTNVSWKKMRGRTVIVTGEEGLDERWPNTPVIMVDRVQVVQ